jgi:hypothetical protein
MSLFENKEAIKGYSLIFLYQYSSSPLIRLGAVVVMILWSLDLQLPVQSVPITTKVVDFEPHSWWGVLDITLCDKVSQWLATGRLFTPVPFTNKIDHQDITEILLKVALNTINLTPYKAPPTNDLISDALR